MTPPRPRRRPHPRAVRAAALGLSGAAHAALALFVTLPAAGALFRGGEEERRALGAFEPTERGGAPLPVREPLRFVPLEVAELEPEVVEAPEEFEDAGADDARPAGYGLPVLPPPPPRPRERPAEPEAPAATADPEAVAETAAAPREDEAPGAAETTPEGEGGEVPEELTLDAGQANALVVRRVLPSYRREWLARGLAGVVVVRVEAAADGGVDEVSVLASSGSIDLDREALRSLSRWRFDAALQRELNPSRRYRVRVVFDPGADAPR